ncbi:MAG TPA: hypothetical protein VD995_03530 [Azospirillum sp.]|nr:hypothetical protein [Azospirillum sp.]
MAGILKSARRQRAPSTFDGYFLDVKGRSVGPLNGRQLAKLAAAGLIDHRALIRRKNRGELRPLYQDIALCRAVYGASSLPAILMKEAWREYRGRAPLAATVSVAALFWITYTLA